MKIFQGMIFIWIRIYRRIFKSALMYLWKQSHRSIFTFEFIVIVATIEILHKIFSLYPSPNAVLFTTRRSNKLFNVLFTSYFCCNNPFGYCTGIIIAISSIDLMKTFSTKLSCRHFSFHFPIYCHPLLNNF